MASITRLNGRWKVRYWTPDGQHQKAKTFDLKSEAQKFARRVETAKDRGEWIDPALGKTTFGQWCERFMDTTVHLKPKTRSGYEGLLRTLLVPAFGHLPLVKIQPLHVRQWVAQLSDKGLSPSRIRQAYFLLGAIMRSAVESGYIVKSPCVGIKPPKMVPVRCVSCLARKWSAWRRPHPNVTKCSHTRSHTEVCGGERLSRCAADAVISCAPISK